MNPKNKKRGKIFTNFIPTVFLMSFLWYSCSNTIKENLHYNEIEVPTQTNFCMDTVTYNKLPVECSRGILRLDESSASITDNKKYSFRTDELIQIQATESEDSIRITSYSAKTVYDVTLEIYLSDFDLYLPVAYMDSIPGFSQFEFKPYFIGKRILYKKPDGQYISFEHRYIDMQHLKPRLVSQDAHLKMLQQIDAQWTLCFSNYDWKDENNYKNWREMKAIFAREWIVILTNYAYMMTTPEYKHVMTNFSKVFGRDLYDNNEKPFTAEDYLTKQEEFKKPHRFNLGRTGDQVSGLGGGSTLGIAGYNFYGHYASYSGWEAIGHEFMHCMNYSHSSNLTYSKDGVGWTEFIWQLHLWLSREEKLPYLDRHMLDFTNPAYQEYRDNVGIREEFLDDAKLNKKIQEFYNKSKLVKYLKNNPLK